MSTNPIVNALLPGMIKGPTQFANLYSTLVTKHGANSVASAMTPIVDQYAELAGMNPGIANLKQLLISPELNSDAIVSILGKFNAQYLGQTAQTFDNTLRFSPNPTETAKKVLAGNADGDPASSSVGPFNFTGGEPPKSGKHNILYTVTEKAGFKKVGGIGDVGYEMPKALVEQGAEVTVMLPYYESVRDNPDVKLTQVGEPFGVPFGGHEHSTKLYRVDTKDGTETYAVNSRGFFTGNDIYTYGNSTPSKDPDNEKAMLEKVTSDKEIVKRFGFFSMAALKAAGQLKNTSPFTIIETNDWQTAPTIPMAKFLFADDPMLAGAVTSITIHNNAHQGVFEQMAGASLGLPTGMESIFHHNGKTNLLKGALMFADGVHPVSRGYGQEVLGVEFGEGLQFYYYQAAKEGKLFAITNGVDYNVWNPMNETVFTGDYVTYDSDSVTTGKAHNKKAVFKEFTGKELENPNETSLFAVVTRLTKQKGIDTIIDGLKQLSKEGNLENSKVLILGTAMGDEKEEMEAKVKKLEELYPGQVYVKIAFDENLALKMLAGADFSAMPSEWEPCGLFQLFSMRFGVIPGVTPVGGLKDTVTNIKISGGTVTGTGFMMEDRSVKSFVKEFKRAQELFSNKDELRQARLNAMSARFPWSSQAAKYLMMYNYLHNRGNGIHVPRPSGLWSPDLKPENTFMGDFTNRH